MATKRKTEEMASDNTKSEAQAQQDAPLTDEQKQEKAFAEARNPTRMELRALMAPSGRYAVIGRKTPDDDWLQIESIMGEENANEFLRQHEKDEAIFNGAKPPSEWGQDAPLNLPR